jgi:hypothetical protein
MVICLQIARAGRGRRGFALAEMMISTVVFSTITIGLLMSLISLKRNYAATTDFAINHADQMRISDYMALDLRRALAVNAATNEITIPIYYDATKKIPLLPALDGAGGIFYTATDMSGKAIRTGSGPPSAGLGTDGEFYLDETAYTLYGPKAAGAWGSYTALGITIHYYRLGDTIYRQEGTAAPAALAVGVSDFNFTIDDSDKKVLKTTITFNPTFRSGGTAVASSFYNKTLLRNSRRDMVSGVY